MSNGLIQPLFGGPIDIIGDIHGEAGALCNLLDQLGYDGNGNHPDNRKLVFVGDLVDRGPDSVTVVELVKRFIENGNAQMVLGNHELNLMRRLHKHGNGWFYSKPEVIRKDHAAISFQRLAPSDQWRDEVCEFFNQQPLLLERDDVKVVHAGYDLDSIQQVRDYMEEERKEGNEPNVLDAYDHFDRLNTEHTQALLFKALKIQEEEEDDEEKWKQYTATKLHDQHLTPIPELLEAGLSEQNGNPIKVMTSGIEEPTFDGKSYFAGGKWRWIQRKKWWKNFTDRYLVVVGHYWRRFTPPDSKLVDGFTPSGENPFDDISDYAVFPSSSSSSSSLSDTSDSKATGVEVAVTGVMCIDYSVGIRYEERGKLWSPGAMGTGLCALRLPEQSLFFENGKQCALQTK